MQAFPSRMSRIEKKFGRTIILLICEEELLDTPKLGRQDYTLSRALPVCVVVLHFTQLIDTSLLLSFLPCHSSQLHRHVSRTKQCIDEQGDSRQLSSPD